MHTFHTEEIVKHTAAQDERESKHTVLLDSACSVHLFGEKEETLICKRGETTTMRVRTYQGEQQVKVQSVLVDIGIAVVAGYFNKDRSVSLLSIGQLDKLGFQCYFGNNKALLWRGRRFVSEGRLARREEQSEHNNVYVLDLFQKVSERRGGELVAQVLDTFPTAAEVFYGVLDTFPASKEKGEIPGAAPGDRNRVKDLIHARIGHRQYRSIPKILKATTGLWSNAELFSGNSHRDTVECTACVLGKATKRDRKRKVEGGRSYEVMELVHSDVFGPTRVRGVGGERYFLLVIDEVSGFCTGKCTVDKSMEQLATFTQHYCRYIRTQSGWQVKMHRGDNAFDNRYYHSWARSEGIDLSYSAVGGHDSKVERAIRSICDVANCLLQHSSLPTRYWPYAIDTAIYLHNRTTLSHNSTTPYELVWGRKPDLTNLRVFGCRVFVQNDSLATEGKLGGAKCRAGVMVGYGSNRGSKAYKVLIEGKVVVSSDCKFREYEMPYKKDQVIDPQLSLFKDLNRFGEESESDSEAEEMSYSHTVSPINTHSNSNPSNSCTTHNSSYSHTFSNALDANTNPPSVSSGASRGVLSTSSGEMSRNTLAATSSVNISPATSVSSTSRARTTSFSYPTTNDVKANTNPPRVSFRTNRGVPPIRLGVHENYYAAGDVDFYEDYDNAYAVSSMSAFDLDAKFLTSSSGSSCTDEDWKTSFTTKSHYGISNSTSSSSSPTSSTSSMPLSPNLEAFMVQVGYISIMYFCYEQEG